jgi:methionyl-tRNA formyltransferase
MKWVAYLKGSRGLRVLESFIRNKLVPCAVVMENSHDKLLKICNQNKIEFFVCSNPSNIQHVDWLSELQPDFLFCVGFSKIIPKNVLSIPKLGSFNCHGGKLPEYRGASPIPWQLINGEKNGSAYILRMTSGIDDGPILEFKNYNIHQTENATSLTDKIDDIFSSIAPSVVQKILNENHIHETPQSEISAKYWTRRVPQDGLIDWAKMTAQEVINFCRALTTPYPGAFTYINGFKIILHQVDIHPLDIRGVPGRYVGYKSYAPTILTCDRAVAIQSFTVENSDCSNFPAKYGDDCSLQIALK